MGAIRGLSGAEHQVAASTAGWDPPSSRSGWPRRVTMTHVQALLIAFVVVTPEGADLTTMAVPRLTSKPLAIGALPTAPSCAREVARVQLDSWGLSSLSETTAVVVSELVTNAVRACSDGDAPPRELRFRMSMIGSRVRLEVWDPDPRLPELSTDAGEFDETGRGLQIVDALTSGHWGSAASPEVGGKVVWAELFPTPEQPEQPESAAGQAGQPESAEEQAAPGPEDEA